MITKEEIRINIVHYAAIIIDAAKNDTINIYPSHTIYVKNVIWENDSKNICTDRKKKIKLLKQKKNIDIEALSKYIFTHQNNISWVDLVLSFVSENEVIFIVDIIKQKNISNIQFHACYQIPFGYPGMNKRFDLNWWIDC